MCLVNNIEVSENYSKYLTQYTYSTLFTRNITVRANMNTNTQTYTGTLIDTQTRIHSHIVTQTFRHNIQTYSNTGTQKQGHSQIYRHRFTVTQGYRLEL